MIPSKLILHASGFASLVFSFLFFSSFRNLWEGGGSYQSKNDV